MFRKFGDLLHKIPWWALTLLGLLTLVMMGFFATPFNVIRMAEQGTTKAERSAIKREIDSAFMSGALNVAENALREMKSRSNDPAQAADLDQVIREIGKKRKDLDRELRDVAKSTNLSNQEITDAARSAVQDAGDTVKEATRAAATASRAAALEKVERLNQALAEMRAAQSKAGIDEPSAFKSIQKAIEKAHREVSMADSALAQVERAVDEAARKPITVKRSPAAAGASDAAPGGASSEDDEELNVALSLGEAKLQTETVVDENGKKTRVVRVGDENPLLPPELRQEIRKKVAGDVRRIGIGSAMILVFIPVFIMLMIAKVFIGRSRRAVAFAEVKKQEAESANVNRQIVEAKLQALQAQVEPHFLYNTLANVQALTEIDPVQANQMTGHLINYLRAALPKMRESTSTVGQEVELVEAYLNILKMRMGDRLAFGIEVAPELMALPFPPLMLPSLVENAIKHGLEPKREGGRIDVTVTREGNELRLCVRDTGRGLTGAPVQAGGGVGLSNIRERLQALYGDKGRLILESNEPSGANATIVVPADGVGLYSARPAVVVPPPPTGFWPRFKAAFSKTHSVWSRTMAWVLVVALIALLITFLGSLIALATGNMPLSIGTTALSGSHGMAVGTALLAVAFSALALVAVIVVALLYGLGFFFVGLLLVIPIIILVSIFPAVAPFVFVGAIIYWWMKRRKAKEQE